MNLLQLLTFDSDRLYNQEELWCVAPFGELSTSGRQFLPHQISPAGRREQSTMVHAVQWSSEICHFAAVTSAGFFCCGQCIVRKR